MLQLKQIVKTYVTGELKQDALKAVSICFRESEFVSVLGHSGSGKTTMLNIIGGLDRYDSGDLIINGVSTERYQDADWDYYRNNSIGFVFQSYNLIPHQSVLANVELALTLAGISKKERRKRAVDVLEQVGLQDHLHKKPGQLSGGQMQRVAIARALVNNPDILLADEPTGALDSETSIQIMELLKEIAKEKLVIMVTHNPELAEAYSTRIVRLRDGELTSDSNPYNGEEQTAVPQKRKKISMSFKTALSLSFNNLRTKKGRTLLTAFAGSIGIIGIALILALSNGMNSYITEVQKDTMASYPLTISAETMDLSGMTNTWTKIEEEEEVQERDGVFAEYSAIESSAQRNASVVENNLTEFKKYLEDPESEIQAYLGENGVIYTYDVDFSVYSYNAENQLINSAADLENVSGEAGISSVEEGVDGSFSVTGGSSDAKAENFSEIMSGSNVATVSQITMDSYEVLYGLWPENYDEVILVLDENNSISAKSLYQLGFITETQYDAAVRKIENGEEADEISFSYEELCGHTFYLVAACDHYTENEDGTFSCLEDTFLSEEALLENAVELKIVGIVRPMQEAENADLSTAVAYTSKLTDYVIAHTNESAVVLAQEASPERNVITGMNFEAVDDAAKIADAKEYIANMGISDKASLYQQFLYASLQSGGGSVSDRSGMDETQMAAALDAWLANTPDKDSLLSFYDEYIAGATYEENMESFGKVSYDAPSSISIYADNFEDKNKIAECISDYNEAVGEENQIVYTDYVALLTSSITTIIDGISYVLIAFVAISLIVSSIMIGIITHISVMERTKEIGMLRALGASKRNISQVFNAETILIGCCAGILGIGVASLLLFPINAMIESISGISGMTARIPVLSALILIAISVAVTLIGGLLPAGKAAKKDPVIALRTE